MTINSIKEMGEGMKFINGEVESLKQTLNVRKDEIDREQDGKPRHIIPGFFVLR